MSKQNGISWSYIKSALKQYIKNYWWKFLIVAFVLAVDLILKAILVPQDEGTWHEITIIKDVIILSPARNIGAGFSILQGQTWLLITLTFLFIIALSVFDLFYKKVSNFYAVSTSLILAGAIGNLVDRILFGYVRDFIYLKFINFPVFNIADIALTFGVILILIYIIFLANKKSANDNYSQANEAVEKVNDLQKLDNVDKRISDEKVDTNIFAKEDANNANTAMDLSDTNSQNHVGDADAEDNS